jgi:hypothetical protein
MECLKTPLISRGVLGIPTGPPTKGGHMADIFEYECELCHKLTPTAELVNGLCPKCQEYLIPTFLRFQADHYTKSSHPTLKLIKGGKDGKRNP